MKNLRRKQKDGGRTGGSKPGERYLLLSAILSECLRPTGRGWGVVIGNQQSN